MKIKRYEISWHGQKARGLENDVIRTIIAPEMGGKLVSIVDKRTQREWLVDPGERPFKKIPYGANFIEQDMSGWDEMFPTIIACSYPAPGERFGTLLPDHGEVWSLPWKLEQSPSDSIKLSVIGKALPYKLTRTIDYINSTTLRLHYDLENLGSELMPYIWAAHPQFVYSTEARILLPSRVTQVCNTIPPEWGWGTPETRFDWPATINSEGKRVRIDHAGPSSQKQARKFYVLPDTKIEWAGIIRHPEGDWLRMKWDAGKVPYFGVWVDEGVLSHTSIIALEPTTGYYDSLEIAWNNDEVTILSPRETKSWSLNICFGTDDQHFPMD